MKFQLFKDRLPILAGGITALLGFMLMTAFWPSQLALTVTEDKKGSVVFAASVQPGDTFAIQFLHSVHETPVEEHYTVSHAKEMVLTKVIYESYGVGNPSGTEAGEQFSMKEGKFIVEEMERVLTTVSLRIGKVKANHSLVLDSNPIPFAEWSAPGSRVLLQVKRISPLLLQRQKEIYD